MVGGTGVWVIVVAAGSGARFGGAKQFRDLGGQRVIDWAVQGAARQAEGVVVVVAADRVASVDSDAGPGVLVTAGGVRRSDSVRCGLALVPESADVVLVHDGARPLADAGVYRRVIEAVRCGADAVVPVVEVCDTMRWRSGGTADRSGLAAVQTPQGFRPDVLRAAHASGCDATDDASLAEAAGAQVVLVDGDPRNLKITSPDDLAVMEALLKAAAPGEFRGPGASHLEGAVSHEESGASHLEGAVSHRGPGASHLEGAVSHEESGASHLEGAVSRQESGTGEAAVRRGERRSASTASSSARRRNSEDTGMGGEGGG